MKPNLEQLQNCNEIPYGCLLVETQQCVEYPARHDCHMEMQAKTDILLQMAIQNGKRQQAMLDILLSLQATNLSL